MNEETAFIDGRPCTPELKRNLRLLFQTTHRPDVVAAVEAECGKLLGQIADQGEYIERQNMALDDANDNAAHYRDKTEASPLVRRVFIIGITIGIVFGAGLSGLARLFLS